MLRHATCLHLTSSNDQRYVPGMITWHDNLSPFKIHDFRLSSRQADNQLAGKSLSHMQTLGYHGKMCLKYVIIYTIKRTTDLNLLQILKFEKYTLWMSNNLQPLLNLKQNGPSHWLDNKPITAI